MNEDSLQYIAKIDQLPLWNAGLVELWDFSRANENEESRIEAIATVASICHGRPPKDAKKLVERLWKEPNGLPSSAFEFVRPAEEPNITMSLRNTPDIETDECYYNGIREQIKNILDPMHRANVATFRLKIPIFLARQVMRHRAFSFQERSLRFAEVGLEDSTWFMPNESFEEHNAFAAIYEQEIIAYRRLLEAGTRREIARAVLGMGLMTEFWMMGDVPAWKNYFKLRTDSHAQKEHRQLAEAMLELLKKHQPELYEKVRP